MSEEKRILVTRSSMPPFEEYVEAIRPLWDSAWLTNMGANHQELGRQLEDYLHVKHVSLFVNGHMALELCIQAMGLTGEVITTPFTFVSTTHAIMRNGLTPVFCDINPNDYTIDPDQIEDLITERTSAIIPVHVYGNVCNVKKIEAIAKKHHLKVLYDAAHTFGVEVDGAGVGSFGDASMFSFHATKVFHTIEGGAVTTADDHLIAELYKLKDFGIKDEETTDGIGANAKMNEFQAIMGLCNLRHVDGEIDKRKAVVERYRENLDGIPGLRLVKEQPGVKANYAYFPIIIEETRFGMTRDELFYQLKMHNIHARKYFYPLTSSLACFGGQFDVSLTPVAKRISERVMTLPMSASLPLADVDRICRIIREK
ncbi:MAG: DegT/DnrJ/EryC1/StrS family aminotransferase [Lachnospiraceae bacterium]